MPTSERLRDLAPRQQIARESLFSGGFGFALIAAATVAVGAGIGVVGYLWSAPEPTSPDVTQAVLSATAPRSTADNIATDIAPEDDSSWTEADLKRCSEEADAAADVAAQRKLAAVSANRVGLGAPDADTVRDAAFLLCSARSKPKHLCKGYYRKSFITAIRAHAAAFRKVTSSAYWLKVDLADQARRDAANRGEIQQVYDDLDQTTRDVARLHSEISDALQLLITNGVIKRDDFGNFLGYGIPPDIGSMLGDARAQRKLCG